MKWSKLPNKPSEFPQLWLARVEEASEQKEQSCRRLLSASEYKRYKLIKFPLKQRQYLLSRWLIRHALSATYNQPMDFWDIEERVGKFPVIHNLPPQTYLSLSHSNDNVLFAISNLAIGVDIEKVSKRKNIAEMAELFMTPDELDLFHKQARSESYFYKTWCLKEAYFKSLPSAEQQNISLRKIDTSKIRSENSNQLIINTHSIKYALAIYSEKNLNAKGLSSKLVTFLR
ncbi:MAG: 4'-phosphopantetheinyl transferase superfamily protein [Methylophaga sp.]